MAVIEYDAYKQKLLALEPTLKELEQALNIESARKELAELQAMHCHAAILGKSIYTGAIDLAEAVRLYET